MIPIIIPAFEPDERLLSLLNNLNENGLRPIVVVNDGSNQAYSEIFDRAEKLLRQGNGILLVHETNRGKGRALKTAFEYVRDFSGEGIPWKSRFGNNLTEKVFGYVAGVHVSDTQTGLRGIPLWNNYYMFQGKDLSLRCKCFWKAPGNILSGRLKLRQYMIRKKTIKRISTRLQIR